MNDKTKYILVAILLIVIILAMRKFFKTGKLAVKELESEYLIDETSKSAANVKTIDAFKPSYYKQFKNSRLMKAKFADFLAQGIYSTKEYGVINSEAMLKIFNNFKTWTQISYVAEVFEKKYGTSLIDYIYSPLPDKILQVLDKYINSLPKK